MFVKNMSTLYAAKVVPTPEKPKKPRTEKQIAAFEKAKETRARKQEEKRKQEEQDLLAKQNELEEANRKLEELEEKKRIANEKRKASREAKRKQQEEEPPSVPNSPKPVKKKQKKEEEAKSETTLVETEEVKKVDETVPPVWFKKYIEGMAQTQNQLEGTKKAQKVIREEAKTVADEKWAQPSVRQQVTKTVDSHMDKMYAQIFGGRRLNRI
jgi:hypothetical protein